MIVTVDPGSAVPPFEQIRSQIADLILTGALSPGTRLPAIRQLASDLGVASGTVARAYRELERATLIEGRGRRGMSVLAPAPGRTADLAAQQLNEVARELVLRARRLGVEPDEALRQAQRALDPAPDDRWSAATPVPLADA